MAVFKGVRELQQGASIEVSVDVAGAYVGSAGFYASGDVARRIVESHLKATSVSEWILTLKCGGAIKSFESSMVIDFENEERGVSFEPAFVMLDAEQVT
ncbi:MAG: hypothetical protein ACRD2W_20860 [Acidimicrobiales bacterium]